MPDLYPKFFHTSNPCLKEVEREGTRSLAKTNKMCAFRERLAVDLNLSQFSKVGHLFSDFLNLSSCATRH